MLHNEQAPSFETNRNDCFLAVTFRLVHQMHLIYVEFFVEFREPRVKESPLCRKSLEILGLSDLQDASANIISVRFERQEHLSFEVFLIQPIHLSLFLSPSIDHLMS